jgi:ABC-type polar amino acid transport system ATPase subunit
VRGVRRVREVHKVVMGRGARGARSAMNALDVNALGIQRGDRLVVRGVSFQARRREILVLRGASGSGKTTVLRAVAGLDPIAEGRVTVDGVSIQPGPRLRGEARRQLYRRVGMVFQFHNLFGHLTALQNVWLAPVHVLNESQGRAEARARQLLDELGVGARADALPHELSGGEAQRVAIARALAVGPPLLLLDEPTASLDPARRGELAATLRGLADADRTLIVATHDEPFVQACEARVLTMDAGKLI